MLIWYFFCWLCKFPILVQLRQITVFVLSVYYLGGCYGSDGLFAFVKKKKKKKKFFNIVK